MHHIGSSIKKGLKLMKKRCLSDTPLTGMKHLDRMQEQLERLKAESIREVIISRYFERDCSISDLANMFDVTPCTIRQCFRAFGFQSKPPKRAMAKYWNWPDPTSRNRWLKYKMEDEREGKRESL